MWQKNLSSKVKPTEGHLYETLYICFFCCTIIQKRETERDRSVKKIWMIYSIYCTLFVKRLCLNFFLFRRDRFELQYSASFDQSSQILYHSHVFDTKREERYEYFDWFFEFVLNNNINSINSIKIIWYLFTI